MSPEPMSSKNGVKIYKVNLEFPGVDLHFTELTFTLRLDQIADIWPDVPPSRQATARDS